MEILKKIYKFIASMKFAIILLIVVAVACMIGSLVPQGELFEQNRASYPARTAAFILAFHLDDVFHSLWFIVLVALLCLSVLLCNLGRVRSLIRKTRDAARVGHALSEEPSVSKAGVADPKAVFRRLRFFRPTETTVDGKKVLFAYRNRFGYWGAWVCHLGIVLIVLGYALGQMTLFSTYVYGTPGQTKPIEGTPYTVTIDGFRTVYNDAGFVEQYVSALTVTDPATGKTQSGTSSVNHPAVLNGCKLYQNATGDAVRVTISGDGTESESADLCVGEALTISFMPGLSMYLYEFEADHDGSGQAAYHILFFYQGEFFEEKYIAPGGVIDLHTFRITLSDPIEYTILRVKKDRFAWLVLLGAVLTTLGLFFALYVVPERLWAVREEDGTWTVNGKSRKLATLFAEQFDRAVSERPGKEAGK